MNSNSELSAFYEKILADARIGTTHISLFMAFYQLWNLGGRRSPVLIKRRQVMELAKISSSATYHKCLKHLVQYGYVHYFPCSNPANKSEIYFTKKDQPGVYGGAVV